MNVPKPGLSYCHFTILPRNATRPVLCLFLSGSSQGTTVVLPSSSTFRFLVSVQIRIRTLSEGLDPLPRIDWNGPSPMVYRLFFFALLTPWITGPGEWTLLFQ